MPSGDVGFGVVGQSRPNSRTFVASSFPQEALMPRQNDFSIFLSRDELLALQKFISGCAPDSPAVTQAMPGGFVAQAANYLHTELSQVCASLGTTEAEEAFSLSMSLAEDHADALAGWIGRLTVNQIECVVDDADTADAASLALWNLMDVLKPFNLVF